MEPNEQHVSTEAQRLALEAMSAQLVHKLNAMIREQEERARAFAEQHHSTLSIPQQQPIPATESVKTAPTPGVPPPPPLRKQENNTAFSRPPATPQYHTQKEKAAPEEGSNIGLAMIIFSMLGIMMLLRACT